MLKFNRLSKSQDWINGSFAFSFNNTGPIITSIFGIILDCILSEQLYVDYSFR